MSINSSSPGSSVSHLDLLLGFRRAFPFFQKGGGRSSMGNCRIKIHGPSDGLLFSDFFCEIPSDLPMMIPRMLEKGGGFNTFKNV